ncbi:Rubredoxin-like superfamily protein [Hibiscus syriacus]|uniref:Rubredoxin-like superfamily protein n=1 Tax=Hibiscus syriacus TaxID=106335 RepID=A0A6A3CPF0_HIBSY|nr:probable transcription factor At3g04930 [Hibiscus syriacus]KAE8729108.1 Rubredoxin-like superfamily protein [Hibiscus syriacus]
MASEQYGAVFDGSQDDDEEPSSSDHELDENDNVLNEEEDEELLEEVDINSPSLLPQPIATAVPLNFSSSTAVTIAAVSAEELPPDPKRQRVDFAVEEKKKPPPPQLDDSRRLFQRLWTDGDEIELLRGFLDYSTLRMNSGAASSHHHHHLDTALFYDQVKSKLQLDFNKNQLLEKLRRLKKKYRTVMSKISSGKEISFKTPHDEATFEISSRIWSNIVGKVEDNVLDDENNNNKISLIDESQEKKNFTPKSTAMKKRARNKGVKMEEKRVLNDGTLITNSNYNDRTDNDNDNGNVEGFSGGGVNVAVGVIEETVRSCLTPMLKELLGSVMGGGGYGGRGISQLAMNAMPLSFGGSLNFCGGGGNAEPTDERWRKLQILELEVYSKRLELVQDQIKAALEELRSINR